VGTHQTSAAQPHHAVLVSEQRPCSDARDSVSKERGTDDEPVAGVSERDEIKSYPAKIADKIIDSVGAISVRCRRSADFVSRPFSRPFGSSSSYRSAAT
jgi:hypothetical protein